MGNRRYGVPKEMQWNTTTSARGHFPFFVAPDPSLVHGDQTLEQQSKKQRSARFFGKAIDASARPCCVCQKKSNACLLAKQQQRRRTLCRQNATKRNQMQSQTTTAQKDALGVVTFLFGQCLSVCLSLLSAHNKDNKDNNPFCSRKQGCFERPSVSVSFHSFEVCC